MFDMMKRAFMTGIGLAVMTSERVEEMAREMAKAGQLSADKGAEFVKEAVNQAAKTRTEFEQRVASIVQENLSRSGVATRADIDRLIYRIEELERKLAVMSQSSTPPG